ncbi:MAG TPA: cohesin domain-containing protein [Dongiaceae bacterium]|nr:cohesin domain-containing protein [Dongiaceae bacterium]
MISRRTYLLITRSSLLLIGLLVAAPLVDFYRFGRFVPTGAAALPIGAILPTARGASTSAPDTTDPTEPPARRAAAAAPSPAAPSPAAPPIAATPAPIEAPARTASFRPAVGRPTTSSAAPPSEFLAWTAWGQIDPFWDGNERASRRGADDTLSESGSSATELADAGVDLAAETAPAESFEASGRTSKKADAPRNRSSLRTGDPRVETPEGDAPGVSDASGDNAPGSADTAPPIDGWIVGNPPAPTHGSEGDRVAPDPSPAPPPAGGGIGPSRALSRDPKPRPITSPTARIEAPTAPVGVGESFNVLVRVDSIDQMTSLPFHLSFDPGLLSFVSAQTGPALGALQPVLLASVNPNRPGDLAVGLSLIESSGTFSGAGDLVVLRFQAIASGRSDLAFDHATLRGPASEPVETRFTGASVIVR